MVRAIARQAEAERNRRPRHQRGKASTRPRERLAGAARALSVLPGKVMQLRFLSTLYDIANDRSSTVVFPVPIDSSVRDMFMRRMGDRPGGAAPASRNGETGNAVPMETSSRDRITAAIDGAPRHLHPYVDTRRHQGLASLVRTVLIDLDAIRAAGYRTAPLASIAARGLPMPPWPSANTAPSSATPTVAPAMRAGSTNADAVPARAASTAPTAVSTGQRPCRHPHAQARQRQAGSGEGNASLLARADKQQTASDDRQSRPLRRVAGRTSPPAC